MPLRTEKKSDVNKIGNYITVMQIQYCFVLPVVNCVFIISDNTTIVMCLFHYFVLFIFSFCVSTLLHKDHTSYDVIMKTTSC